MPKVLADVTVNTKQLAIPLALLSLRHLTGYVRCPYILQSQLFVPFMSHCLRQVSNFHTLFLDGVHNFIVTPVFLAW